MAKIMGPCIWNDEIADWMGEMNDIHRNTTGVVVSDVFGSIPGDPIGCSREASRLPVIDWKTFENYVRRLNNNGIEMNYVFNTFSFGAIQDFKDNYDNMVDFLKKLEQVGINIVTVTLPLIMEMIRKEVPNMQINVSTITHVDTIQQAKYYVEQLGVKRITLKLDSNRDFKFLEQLAKLDCDIELMATEFCMWNCPWRDHHYDLQSHNSKFGPFANYPYGRCISAIDSPAKWLMTRFIRPEDMKIYENIGIEYFKVTGRTFSKDWVKNALTKYYQRSHDGNLMDICPMIINIGHKKLPPQVYIPNKKLDGFLDYFRDSGVNCNSDCGVKCNFCSEFADKIGARKLSKEERFEYTANPEKK
jgi:collagenase-like PrtC family protease